MNNKEIVETYLEGGTVYGTRSNKFVYNMAFVRFIVDFAFMTDDDTNIPKFIDENYEKFVKEYYWLCPHELISEGRDNPFFNGMCGMTFYLKHYDIIKDFLRDVEGFKSYARDDNYWYDNYKFNNIFVKWSDIRKIDREKFNKLIDNGIAEFANIEEKYSETKKQYEAYREERDELYSKISK